jgi:hypothetical protein
VAATLPELPLERGEFAEVVLRGAFDSTGGPGRLVSFFERFFGARIGSRRWIVLTNNRLLLLRRRKPGAYKKGEWFDVSLDRRRIRASAPFVEGSLVVVTFVSSKGPATLLLPRRSFKEAERFARALGAAKS